MLSQCTSASSIHHLPPRVPDQNVVYTVLVRDHEFPLDCHPPCVSCVCVRCCCQLGARTVQYLLSTEYCTRTRSYDDDSSPRTSTSDLSSLASARVLVQHVPSCRTSTVATNSRSNTGTRTAQNSTEQFSTVQSSMVQFSTVQCSIVQCATVRTVQYCTLVKVDDDDRLKLQSKLIATATAKSSIAESQDEARRDPTKEATAQGHCDRTLLVDFEPAVHVLGRR